MIFKHWAFFHTRLIFFFFVISQFSSLRNKSALVMFYGKPSKLFLWALHCTWKSKILIQLSIFLFCFSKRCEWILVVSLWILTPRRLKIYCMSVLSAVAYITLHVSLYVAARERIFSAYVARATAKSQAAAIGELFLIQLCGVKVANHNFRCFRQTFSDFAVKRFSVDSHQSPFLWHPWPCPLVERFPVNDIRCK